MAVPTTAPTLGVASEVGTLRSVVVHRPDLAHERLSPTNCHDLLFDDVIWVRRARQEFDAFVDLMRERGVEVLLFHEILAETLADMAQAFGDRPAAVARELTKRFEEVRRGSLATLASHYADNAARGELTVVVGPAPAYIARRADRWRWNVVLRGDDPVALLDGGVDAPWSVDVDPESLL